MSGYFDNPSRATSSKAEDPESPMTPPPLSPSALPKTPQLQEVSLVEEEATTGVTFTPELWMQRRQWALSVLRKEAVRSVLDIGCGAGALLETLVMPATTVHEPPIRPIPRPTKESEHLPSPVASEFEDGLETEELYIQRLGGIDPNPGVIPSALAVMTPANPASTSYASGSSSAFPPNRPRWEPLQTDLWLGGIERYNNKMEGYEAMTCLEVIEHLDPQLLSRFGVNTMGTYRPKLMLVTTPNFDFNAKFPQSHDHDHEHPKKGFTDPTGRTDRVFRHSDHKLEMTSGEFREWALAAAADWGYEVELGGVGISSIPSYYPANDPHVPNEPIYATQTAIFRLASVPTRSPRSVRSTPLPFMPGSSESSHPHKLAGRYVHPKSCPGTGKREPPGDVLARVRETFEEWNIPEVGLSELWGKDEIAGACNGSKRYLVGLLGGWGDCAAISGSMGQKEFEVKRERGKGFRVVWKKFEAKQAANEQGSSWGQKASSGGTTKGGW